VSRKDLKFDNTQCSFITSLYFKPEFARSNWWKTPDCTKQGLNLVRTSKVIYESNVYWIVHHCNS